MCDRVLRVTKEHLKINISYHRENILFSVKLKAEKNELDCNRSVLYFTLFVIVKKKKPARVPPIDCKRKQKSDTIKSNNSALEDFNTPPESPSLNSASLSLSTKTDNPSNFDEPLGGNLEENDEKSVPPIPPPRTRRGMATKSAKNKLKELHIAAESLEIVAYELVNIGESLDMSSTSPVPHNGKPVQSINFRSPLKI